MYWLAGKVTAHPGKDLHLQKYVPTYEIVHGADTTNNPSTTVANLVFPNAVISPDLAKAPSPRRADMGTMKLGS